MAEFGTTRDTVDVIRTLVSELTPTVVIEDATDNLDGTYTLSIFKTYWLRPQKEIVIDSSVYKIISFVMNESITIQDINSSGIPTVQDFKLPAPNFYHGTTIMAASEQSKHKDPKLKTPFVWLYERLEETEITDPLNKWGRESEPRLFFMDEARYADWTSTQHKTGAIDPIRQMVELMFFNIENQRGLYDRVNEYKTTNIANWGKFNTDKGHADRFFAQDLSGILCNFTLVMSKTACDNRNSIGPSECTIGATLETTPSTGSNGTATAIVTGGQGDISFLWSDGQTTNPAIDLPVGPISVIVTDSITPDCTAFALGNVEDSGFEFGNYLEFNGVSNYLFYNKILFGTVDFTMSMWLRWPQGQSAPVDMVFGDSMSSGNYIWVNTTNIRMAVGGVLHTLSHGGILTNTLWNHVLYYRSGTTISLYINDQFIGSFVEPNGFGFDYIGRFTGGNYMQADMDETGILIGTAPTLSQIGELYNSGNGGNFDDIMGSSTAYWRFNKSGTDIIATDENGNHDALLINFPASGMWKPRV